MTAQMLSTDKDHVTPARQKFLNMFLVSPEYRLLSLFNPDLVTETVNSYFEAVLKANEKHQVQPSTDLSQLIKQ